MLKILPRLLVFAILGVVALFGLIQLVPYGRNHTNPPVLQEPRWDASQTRALAQRACFDCHSNETAWPWYSHVAPVSWLVQHDVEEGRSKLNFSEWGRAGEIDEIVESVQEGEMPPSQYLPTHPEARLTPAELAALIQGFEATFGVGATNGNGEPDDD